MYLSIHNITKIKRSSHILKADKERYGDVDTKITEIVVTDEDGNRHSITLFHSTD